MMYFGGLLLFKNISCSNYKYIKLRFLVSNLGSLVSLGPLVIIALFKDVFLRLLLEVSKSLQ